MIYDAQYGNYQFRADTDTRRIFPKGKDGKSVPVMLVKHTIAIKHHADDEEIVFSRYRHQGRWYWRDSRDKSSTTRDHVVSELSRMLKLDKPEASALVRQHLVA